MIITLVFVTVLLVSGLAHSQTTYTLLALPPPASGRGIPVALDQAGTRRAVGTSLAGKPVLFTEDAAFEFALLAGGGIGAALDLCGPYTVGYSGTGPFGGQTHAVLWDNGDPVDLGTANGDPTMFSTANAVTCSRWVAGRGWVEAAEPVGVRLVPLLWDPDGEVSVLEVPQLSGPAVAEAISARLDVVGSVTVGTESQCALWPAPTHDLHTCHLPGARRSMGFGVNNAQQVVGPLLTAEGEQRGFLREKTGRVQVLDCVPGLPGCLAAQVNDAGLVVGESYAFPERAGAPFASQCTLWQDTPASRLPVPRALRDLVSNGAGWELRRCLGVNPQGVLLGSGLRDGVETIFLAIPTALLAVRPPSLIPDPVKHLPRGRRLQASVEGVRERLAGWQEYVDLYQDKHARWQTQVGEDDAAAGRRR
jgi:hypothetical protein